MRLLKFTHDRVLRRGFLWWFIISFLFYLASIVIVGAIPKDEKVKSDTIITTTSINEDSKQIGKDDFTILPSYSSFTILSIIIFSMILGILITLFVLRYVKRSPLYSKDITEIIRDKLTRRHLKNALSMIAFFTLLSILFTTVIPAMIPQITKVNLLKEGLQNPGGFFAFITGAGTLIGTYLAINSILEMKRTITSYPQLLERLTELILDAKDEDGTCFLCYFPLPGAWQVKFKHVLTEFEKALRNSERKIKIIGLDQFEHLRYLITIARKKNEIGENYDAKKILKFQKKCMNILSDLGDTSGDETASKSDKFHYEPKMLSLADMPQYYFFVSNHRAIVVTPVGLPTEDSLLIKKSEAKKILATITENADTEEKIKEKEDCMGKIDMLVKNGSKIQIQEYDKGAKVETFGFETRDSLIIQKLQDIFKDYEKKINSNPLTI